MCACVSARCLPLSAPIRPPVGRFDPSLVSFSSTTDTDPFALGLQGRTTMCVARTSCFKGSEGQSCIGSEKPTLPYPFGLLLNLLCGARTTPSIGKQSDPGQVSNFECACYRFPKNDCHIQQACMRPLGTRCIIRYVMRKCVFRQKTEFVLFFFLFFVFCCVAQTYRTRTFYVGLSRTQSSLVISLS